MRSILVLVAVALVALIGGVAVTGLPDSVPQDVVSGDIGRTSPLPPSSPATMTAVDTSTTLIEEAALTVVVANATNAPGLAASVAQELRELGYADVVETPATAPRRETVIVYAAGREGAARRLAEQLGLAATRVESRGDGPLTIDDATADLWALLGADLA